ncbi:MAG: hypothetical protein ACJAYU_004154 [Bradymonadia bacterium]|jgi:hypothetical protein
MMLLRFALIFCAFLGACDRPTDLGTPTNGAARIIRVVASSEYASDEAQEVLSAALDALDGWDVGDSQNSVEARLEAQDGAIQIVARAEGEFGTSLSQFDLDILVGCGSGPSECLAEAAARFAVAFQTGVMLGGADHALVLEALGSPRQEIVLLAAHEAARRGIVSACPALAEYLPTSSTQGAFLAFAGVAAQLGCRDAAEPMIAAIPVADSEMLVAIMPALAQIGGPAATGYLQTLASAHDDAAVRTTARAALRRMQHQE